MTGELRIAVDSLVAKASPDLVIPVGTSASGLEVTVFGAFDSPNAIAGHLTELKPDVIVVDPAWLVAAALLESLAGISGVGAARRVVGAMSIDDVLKIQAAHRGMFDVLDLSASMDDVVSALRRIHAGGSSLSNDELWRRVPRPPKLSDITSVPQDTVDLAILELICIGYRDHDIAEALHYSVQAVKNRVGNMFKRSGLTNRTQLAWQFTNQLLTTRMVLNMQNSADQTLPADPN